MNTVLKGDQFEDECYIHMQNMLSNHELPLIPSMCIVRQKPRYYSKDREDTIIFDISIEAWPKGAENYTLLYLIECKNYKKEVPINDVEEFYAKIQQVAGVNVKGVFIAKNSFQKGAYNFARSKGMMLITGDQNLTFSIILHKVDRYKQIQTETGFLDVNSQTLNDPLFQIYIARKWQRHIEMQIISSMIFSVIAESFQNEVTIPVLSGDQIEEMVSEILNAYDSDVIYRGKPLNIEAFQKYLQEVFELQTHHIDTLGVDSAKRPIISACSFTTKTIEIDRSIVDTDRYSFAFGHEVGHFFLHNKLSLNQTTYEGFKDSVYSFAIDKHIINNERGWVEWQANKFASCLILPKQSLFQRFLLEQEKIGLRPGKTLFVDSQKVNRNDFHRIVGNLALFFGTTKTTVIYRLVDLKILKFDLKYKGRSVGQIISEIYPGMFV